MGFINHLITGGPHLVSTRATGLQRGLGGRRLRRLRAELPPGGPGDADLWDAERAAGGGAQCLGGWSLVNHHQPFYRAIHIPYMGLSENSVPLPMVNDHYPY